MRQALRTKRGAMAQTSQSTSLPAPIRGLNARDSITDMKEGFALVLNNLFPKTSYLEIRGGCANHLTGMTGTPKTLAVYNKLDGTSKMYAVTSAGVFDASSAGAVGASLAARTNGKHQYLNFGDGTNNYLMMFNGVDKPLYFDGTTWTAVDAASSPALTGLTTTRIVSAFASKGRLYFLEIESLSFWYLAAGAAGGALTEFPLDGVAQHGGYIIAAETWTFDGGDGVDDAVVFVTSEGEVIVYKGTNPASATAWILSGVFHMPRPLGRRCLERAAGDLLLITEGGVFPLSAALQSATVDHRASLTDIIRNELTTMAGSYGSTFGWEITLLPSQSAIILNVPVVEGGEHIQYVMNTITKAWCKFTEWDAETFVDYNGDLYFATDTKIVKAWTGTSDYGNNIEAYGKTAFSYFGIRGTEKRFTLFRPILNVNGSISFLTGIDVDFKDTTISDTASYSVVAGAVWDVALWDEAYWAAGMEVTKRWTSPDDGIGYCAAGKLKIATNSLTVQWMSNDMVFEQGGIL